MTYKEVGRSAGLNGTKLGLYITYMIARWGDTEEQKCGDGYALEWAERFLAEQEIECSDREGKDILATLHKLKLFQEALRRCL